MELTCPKCHGAMRTYERNGVHVDQCTDCRGIFLDRGELDRLIDAENAWHGGRRQRPHAGTTARTSPRATRRRPSTPATSRPPRAPVSAPSSARCCGRCRAEVELAALVGVRLQEAEEGVLPRRPVRLSGGAQPRRTVSRTLGAVVVAGDVDVVAQLAGQPQPHPAAGEVLAVRRPVAGERVVEAGTAVTDRADDPVAGDPQPQARPAASRAGRRWTSSRRRRGGSPRSGRGVRQRSQARPRPCAAGR